MIKKKIEAATPARKHLISAKKSCKPPFAGPAPRDPRRKTALRAPAERENPAGIERRGRPTAAPRLIYSLSGGVDDSLFSIDPTTGDVTFNTSPDFEHLAGNGAINVYDIVVRASDGVHATRQAGVIWGLAVSAMPVYSAKVLSL